MTQPQYYPPHPPMHAWPPQNGLGTAGFVLGLLALIVWPLAILGLIFSAVGIGKASRREATNRGLAVAGVVLSLISLLFGVVWIAVIGAMI
jgi:Na+/H+-dicarboxylate symporter